LSLARAVVFTSAADFAVRRGIRALHDAWPDIEWLVLEERRPHELRRIVRANWRHLRRNGWRWIPHRVADVAGRVPWPGRRRQRDVAVGRELAPERVSALPRVRWERVPALHDPAVVTLIREWRPDLGLSLGAPILKASLFDVPRLGTLNLHKGRLPDYRGMPPAFWELANGEREIGCSVHRVVSDLDAGDVLAEAAIATSRFPSVRGLQLQLDEIGIALTVEAVRRLREGDAIWRAQPAGGRTWRRPTLAEVSALEQRLREAERRLASAEPPGLRRLAKHAALGAYARVLAPPARRVRALRGRQRSAILLYHRVSDELRDTLTVGLEQFEAQMQWLARHCTVASLADIVAGRIARRGSRPIVAVTFDDGYRDNAEAAAPILLRTGVPATFFVCTGRISDPTGFDHDRRRLGHTVPTMTWEDLARVRRDGFDVGSHTVTHINCGRSPPDLVHAELDRSRETLVERLGLAAIPFAYPFGGRDDITEAAREHARRIGFTCCVSAYGGYNDGEIDPFRLRRTNIDFRCTMPAFRARVEGLAR